MWTKIKDILIRTLKTFLEGFVGALPVTISTSDLLNTSIWQATLIAAGAAGACAVLNAAIVWIKSIAAKKA